MAETGQALRLLITVHAFSSILASLLPAFLLFVFTISTHSIFMILLPRLPSLYSKHHVLAISISLLPSFHYVFPESSQPWIYPTIASLHGYPVGFWMLLEVHSRSPLGFWLSLAFLAWASLCPLHEPFPNHPALCNLPASPALWMMTLYPPCR